MVLRFLLALLFLLVATFQTSVAWSNADNDTVTSDPLASHSTMVPTLRPSVVVEADLVTLGDLFDFAGMFAETPVFRAPPPGTRGAVSSDQIRQAAMRAGLQVIDTGSVQTVQIERAGTLLDASAMETLVIAELERFRELRFGPGAGEYKVSLSGTVQAQLVGREKVDDLRVDFVQPPANRTGAFVASIRTRHGEEIERLAGTAQHIVRAPVLSRPVSRGDVIQREDLQVIELAYARSISTPTVLVEADIVGKAASRSLRVGTPFAPSDLSEPLLVDRQEIITLVYKRGALALTVRARSMDRGALGQAVDVVNLQSNNVVRGVVTNRGVVEVLSTLGQVAEAQLGVAR